MIKSGNLEARMKVQHFYKFFKLSDHFKDQLFLKADIEQAFFSFFSFFAPNVDLTTNMTFRKHATKLHDCMKRHIKVSSFHLHIFISSLFLQKEQK